MDTLFGLPAHPLLVHIPIVLIPVAALMTLAMLVRPQWRRSLGWLTVAFAGVGFIGAQLATMAGDKLEERLGEHSALLEQHAERGDQARTAALVFFLFVAGWVAYTWWTERPVRSSGPGATAVATTNRTAVLAVSILAVVTGLLATGAVIRAGHSGARSAWCDPVGTCPAEGGEGGGG